MLRQAGARQEKQNGGKIDIYIKSPRTVWLRPDERCCVLHGSKTLPHPSQLLVLDILVVIPDQLVEVVLRYPKDTCNGTINSNGRSYESSRELREKV